MSEFVGRTGSQRVYSYPEAQRGNALSAFARNFATGPKVATSISGDRLIPWNAIDTTARAFTITAGGITVSIAGDVTALFNSGDNVNILPLAPATLPIVAGVIASAPVFASGVTTFDLSAPIDGSTVGGAIENTSTTTTDVPITPKATGAVLITGVVGFTNGSGGPVNVTVTVEANGAAIPVSSAAVGDGTLTTVPFSVEAFLPIGSPSNIQVSVTGDGANLTADGSSINIQEVAIATG